MELLGLSLQRPPPVNGRGPSDRNAKEWFRLNPSNGVRIEFLWLVKCFGEAVENSFHVRIIVGRDIAIVVAGFRSGQRTSIGQRQGRLRMTQRRRCILTSASFPTDRAVDVRRSNGVDLTTVLRPFPRQRRRRGMLRHFHRHGRHLLLLLLISCLRQISASLRQLDRDLEVMLSSRDATETTSIEQRQPGVADDRIGAFQRHGFLLAFATDVIEREKKMMLVVEIGRKSDFDLVVEFGRVVVMEDVGGGGGDESAIRR